MDNRNLVNRYTPGEYDPRASSLIRAYREMIGAVEQRGALKYSRAESNVESSDANNRIEAL